jgi:hypothetical protein
MAPAIAAMASILFRMVNSFAMDARRVVPGTQTDPIHRARHRSPKNVASYVAIFGIFCAPRNRLKRQASPIVGPIQRIKCASRFDFPDPYSGDSLMVITAAHIQPIVALIAGVLILIMPRFLNLVVAIYLIFVGLAGLGLFKMFHV